MTPSDSDFSLTVVIATRNRRPILAQTLAALAGQTLRDFEVVVVDDGSTDDTLPWLRSGRAAGDLALHVVPQDHGGQGSARNRGLQRVHSRLVLLLGDDILPRPEALAAHVEAHRRLGTFDGAPAATAVVGFTDWCRDRMQVTPLLEMINQEGHQFGYGHMTPGAEVPFTCFYTSNVSLPRRVLGERPFDPSFTEYGWEDVELGYRLSRSGLRLVYEPAAAAEHLHPMSLRSVWERQRTVGRGVTQLLRLHPELENSPLLTPLASPWWFAVGRRVAPVSVPLLDLIDRGNIPMPRRLLHNVLMCAYYTGLQEGLADAPETKDALS